MEELKLIRDNYWATKDGRIYSTKRNRYLKQRVGPRRSYVTFIIKFQ